jgi:NAD-dependent deacetylase
MKKKITIFTGAGISKESGIGTFRDGDDAYWNKFKVEDVATVEGWKRDLKTAFDFYNEMRKEIGKHKPNAMHLAIADLEKEYEVIVVTQNVDDLHEKAGSTNVIHLHGEMNKMRTAGNPFMLLDYDRDLKPGDEGDDGFELRPHVVLFGEQPYNHQRATESFRDADVRIAIGTSFSVGYTIPLVWLSVGVKYPCGLYIDPKPAVLRNMQINDQSIMYIKKEATQAITDMRTYIETVTKKEKK